MFNTIPAGILTLAYTWSFWMTVIMLACMIPRIERWSWEGLTQDIPVVGFVLTLCILFGIISIRRWFELPESLVSITMLGVAVCLTPITYRIYQKSRGVR